MKLGPRDSPPDLYSPRAPRIPPLQGVTLLNPSRAFVWVMDAIRNRTAKRARRGGRSVAPPDPLPRGLRRKSRTGSGRVPTEFPPPRAGPRQESEFRGAGPASPGTGRNSRGLNGDWIGTAIPHDRAEWERLGTEWGLGPLTIEQTTEDVTAIHRWPRAGSEANDRLATGRRLGNRAEIRGKAGATVHNASRTSDQDGPEPGHLTREARSEQPGGRWSAQTASEWDRSAGKDRGGPPGSSCRIAEVSSAGDLRTRAKRQGGR